MKFATICTSWPCSSWKLIFRKAFKSKVVFIIIIYKSVVSTSITDICDGAIVIIGRIVWVPLNFQFVLIRWFWRINTVIPCNDFLMTKTIIFLYINRILSLFGSIFRPFWLICFGKFGLRVDIAMIRPESDKYRLVGLFTKMLFSSSR